MRWRRKSMKVKIKKLYKDSVLPTKAHATDAGYDLYAHNLIRDNQANLVYTTGVAMEIPQGYVGLIFPRSSISRKDLILTNCVGVIDSGYRGEISFKFKRVNFVEQQGDLLENDYRKGERIGQIIIMPYPEIEFVEVDELSDSDRGDGGYGSSGK